MGAGGTRWPVQSRQKAVVSSINLSAYRKESVLIEEQFTWGAFKRSFLLKVWVFSEFVIITVSLWGDSATLKWLSGHYRPLNELTALWILKGAFSSSCVLFFVRDLIWVKQPASSIRRQLWYAFHLGWVSLVSLLLPSTVTQTDVA